MQNGWYSGLIHMSEADKQKPTNGVFMQRPLTPARKFKHMMQKIAYAHFLPPLRAALNLFCWQELCVIWNRITFQAASHFTSSYLRVGKQKNTVIENENESDFMEEPLADIQFFYFKRTLLARNIGPTLSQAKSDVIWIETFWSSSLKGLSS